MHIERSGFDIMKMSRKDCGCLRSIPEALGPVLCYLLYALNALLERNFYKLDRQSTVFHCVASLVGK